MQVTLTRDLERFVSESVQAGRFQSRDMAIQEAVRLLRSREEERAAQVERLRREIRIGEEQEGRGEVFDYENGQQVLDDVLKSVEHLRNGNPAESSRK